MRYYVSILDSKNLYDASVLIENLRNDQTAVRVASMRKLKDIGSMTASLFMRSEYLGHPEDA